MKIMINHDHHKNHSYINNRICSSTQLLEEVALEPACIFLVSSIGRCDFTSTLNYPMPWIRIALKWKLQKLILFFFSWFQSVHKSQKHRGYDMVRVASLFGSFKVCSLAFDPAGICWLNQPASKKRLKKWLSFLPLMWQLPTICR